MFYFRILSISTLLFVQISSSQASDVELDFQRCATAALQQRGQAAAVITVDTSGLKRHQLDHNAAPGIFEYRMQIDSPTSGEELGVANCKFGRSGDLLAVTFAD